LHDANVPHIHVPYTGDYHSERDAEHTGGDVEATDQASRARACGGDAEFACRTVH
jgi:hypothetical protein